MMKKLLSGWALLSMVLLLPLLASAKGKDHGSPGNPSETAEKNRFGQQGERMRELHSHGKNKGKGNAENGANTGKQETSGTMGHGKHNADKGRDRQEDRKPAAKNDEQKAEAPATPQTPAAPEAPATPVTQDQPAKPTTPDSANSGNKETNSNQPENKGRGRGHK